MEALASGDVNHDAIAEFLVSVDRSHIQGKTLKISPVLGQMEQGDAEYAEGDIDQGEYRKLLMTLLADGDAKRTGLRRAPVSD